MTNRTVQIKGYGFGSSPAEITVTLEGNTVFTGAVTTADSPPPSLPNLDLDVDTVSLCSFEIPVGFTGEKAMTCSVNSGTVIFAQIDINYVPIPNPVFSVEDRQYLTAQPPNPRANVIAVYSTYATPAFSTEELATLESTDTSLENEQLAILIAHGCGIEISGGTAVYAPISTVDARANVKIDGVAQTHIPAEYTGSWWWKIPASSTLAYDLVVQYPGLE